MVDGCLFSVFCLSPVEEGRSPTGAGDGQNCRAISLRGVVGFTGILFKIIATLDAELSRAKPAERPFLTKWKDTHPAKSMLSSDTNKRAKQIKRLTDGAGFPEPSNPNKFGNWLNQLGLTHF